MLATTRNLIIAAALMTAALATAATAAEGRKVTASNGVVVTVDGDDFDPAVRISPPVVRDDSSTSTFAVHRVKAGGEIYAVQAVIDYKGDWRFYRAAYLRGGDEANFALVGRKVRDCQIRPCGLVEFVQATFTRAQLDAALTTGDLAVKFVGQTGGDFVVTFPKASVEAALEVAGGP